MKKDKKGFLYYLNNPAEVAKKLFPFIDVDAMMAENKERYKEFGVNPGLAKNIIGGALNPVMHGVGGGANIALKGLLSSYQKNKAIKQLSKDILSPKGTQRYINNATENLNHTLKDLETRKHITEIVMSTQRGKNFTGWNNKLNKLTQDIQYTKKNIEYLKTPAFKDEYRNIVSHKMKNTPVTFKKDKPYVLGSYSSSQGMGRLSKNDAFSDINIKMLNSDTFAYPGYSGIPKGFKGGININPTSKRKSPTTLVHELKHSVQDALRGYRYSAKKAIPRNEKGRPMLEAEGKFIDALSPGGWETRKAKYLLKPHEISARLSELRINPSKTSRPYKDLLRIFKTDKKVQWAKDNLWATAPVSLIDLAKDNK